MEKFKDWLTEANLKKTKHRLLVLDILYETNDFLSADDLFLKAKHKDANISLSTIYRILDNFVEKNIVSTINMENTKQVYYELAHQEHSHHLICLNCNKVIHLKGCPIKAYEETVSSKYRFNIERHTLDFYGYCEKCRNTKSSKV